MAYKWLSRLRLVGLILSALSLAGCAGGGGSGDSSGSGSEGGAFEFAGITWVAPSEREDGSALSLAEIAGYRIYYGDETGEYPNRFDIDNSIAGNVDLSEISSGKYFAVVTTVDTDGRESAYSVEVEITL